MAKLNHAKIIRGFEALRQTKNGKDFFVGFLKTFGFPASTIRNIQDPNNGRNIAIAEGDYGLAKNMYFRPVKPGMDVNAAVKTLVKDAAITKHKVRFIFATDFQRVVAYDRHVDDWADFDFSDLVENYEFFLPLTGLYEKPLAYTSHPADVKACEKMGKLYDIIRATNHYDDEHLHDLNVFLTRLLFCFFAEDTGIFPIRGQMTKAIESLTKTDGSDMHNFFERLFWILDMEPGRFARKQETPTLAAFPYVNGGLFRDKIRIPTFNARARNILLECGRLEWNLISPVIFGAMFQAVMKPEERHALGAHFTSERNILKVIEPLFLDDLKAELQAILETISETQKKLTKDQTDKLYDFQGKLASLTFLDPACGSGNFLIVSFREIKRLEFEAVKALHRFDSPERSLLDDWKLDASKVSINQFYGIEIEEFPVEVARVSMWLMEHVMNVEFGTFFGATIPTIPLKDSAHIVCANALTTDWGTVVPVEQLSYIIGNPPFSGSQTMLKSQKDELVSVCGDAIDKPGTLDYVTGWYIKAARLIKKFNQVKVAFVSTNSICQGRQVASLWGHIFDLGVGIEFAHQTFKWENEAKDNAGVYCVIIGLSANPTVGKLFVYRDITGTPSSEMISEINGYLIEGKRQIYVREANSVLSGSAKPIVFGNMPIDGGNLIIEASDYDKFASDPEIEPYIKKLTGSKELLHNLPRYCLWLTNAPEEVKAKPIVAERIEGCKAMRLASRDPGCRKLAERAHEFRDLNNPETSIVIPRVSSERREYIPMGFIGEDTIATDSCHIVPNGTIYDFGILESRMHMTWMRTVCGRLESRYRYSRDLCYNTFPWPDAKETQRHTIEVLAQKVLDARDFYPEFTLADLYDPDKMPPELKEAHEQLDRAVDQLYRSHPFANDEERLHMLFERYEVLVAESTQKTAKKGKKK